MSPARPISIATASARAMLDSVGCIKMSSGFDLDLGRVLRILDDIVRCLIIGARMFAILFHACCWIILLSEL